MQMVSDKCHERERQANQTHALGIENFNDEEEEIFLINNFFER